MPKCPQKFAEVVSTVIKRSTPRKKEALTKKVILSPSKKRRLNFLEKNSVTSVLNRIKKTRSRKDLELRRRLHLATSIKNKLKTKTAKKEFGLSWNFLTKPAHLHASNFRKKRSDALSKDNKRKVTDFFNRSDISREMPKQGNPVNVMECSTAYAFRLFKEENPDVQISSSTFHKLRPQNIKPMSRAKLLQCLCEYCVNVKFLLESLRTITSKAGKEAVTIPHVYAASELTLCPQEGLFPRKECFLRVCKQCGVNKIKSHLAPLLDQATSQSQVEWKSWEIEANERGKRMALKQKTGTLADLVDELMMKLVPFSEHLVNAKWQTSSSLTYGKMFQISGA